MKLLTLSIMLAATLSAAAQQKQNFNLPIIQTKYTADPGAPDKPCGENVRMLT